MRQVLIPHQLHDLPRDLPQGDIITLNGLSMGTSWSVRYVAQPTLGHDQTAVQAAIEAALAQVVQQMSTWLLDSDISQFNQLPAGRDIIIPRDFATVLEKALQVAVQSDGCFDPTIGALVDLWGFGPAEAIHAPPSPAAINAALLQSGWRKLGWDSANRRLTQPGGLKLDFSGIAKGFGVDQVAASLQQLGLAHYLVEVGGEFYGQGVKPDGQPWWVALERSDDAGTLDEYVVAMHGLALATSGDYRRYFEYEGRRYAHTLDPATGWPLLHAPSSVSVLAANCMQADALATALTVMGSERGLAYAQTHDIAVLFTTAHEAGLRQQASPALQALLQ